MLDRIPEVLPLLAPWIALALVAVLVLPPVAFSLIFRLLTLLFPSRTLEITIGGRYLKGRRFPRLISGVTYISVCGITVGVMALIIVLGVMSGFEEDLRKKILGTNSHVVILGSGGETIDDWPTLLEKAKRVREVESAAPFVLTQVMISTESGVTGAVLRGIDPSLEGSVTDLGVNLVAGSLADLGEASDPPPVIIGREMAAQLGVRRGDEVRIIVPFGESTPAGPAPRIVSYRVSGIFRSGMFEYDNGLAYIGMSQAQRLLDLGPRVTGIEIKVRDVYRADEVAMRLRGEIGITHVVRDWMEMNQAFFAALKLEKIVMFIILILIVFVASFNIVTSLIMKVLEKNREIAALMALGAGRGQVMGIFMVGGLAIGLVGTSLGALLGIGLLKALDTYKFITLPSSVYYIETLPVKFEPLMLAVICLSSLIISAAATIYPAWKASGVDPVVSLRYE
jgi:lipoprotein-releasing system permease protein